MNAYALAECSRAHRPGPAAVLEAMPWPIFFTPWSSSGRRKASSSRTRTSPCLLHGLEDQVTALARCSGGIWKDSRGSYLTTHCGETLLGGV